MTDLLQGVGWKARGDREPEFQKSKPFFPRLTHALKLIPLFFRLLVHTLKDWWEGRDPFIDIFKPFRHNSYTDYHIPGVPIGGIGCGSIGTDFRGAFGRFSIIPGVKENTKNIKADQFIVSIHSKTNGSLLYQSLLSCAKFREKGLRSWKTMPAENIRYRGLFPRAWTEFKLGDTGITVVCEQVSPVIPNDYEDSSLPVANFEFYVINESDDDIDASITLAFRNGTGNKKWNKENVCRSEIVDLERVRGRTLYHTVKGMEVTFGIFARKNEIFPTTTAIFDPNGDGRNVYDALRSRGCLEDSNMNTDDAAPKELGVAVCSKFSVPKQTTRRTIISLVWYMPKVSFGSAQRVYTRRYARYFNGSNVNEVVGNLAQYANSSHEKWQTKIEEWQMPIIEDQKLPEWYRNALFNELYYVVDGSTTWFEYDENWKVEEALMSEESIFHFENYGRFGYMESWEYFMINTYDVHFYSSWAFIKNWPQIEMSIQLDFADQVERIDKTRFQSLAENTKMEVKKFGKIPHDMGHPMREPWINTNAYILHDTSDWKDLNLKFIISCWRDYQLIAKDFKNSDIILKIFVEKSRLIIENALNDWDTDNDGMIENSGFADQTYDIWTMTGTSAYCGSLWIAALECFVKMCERIESSSKDVERYSEILERCYAVFEKKLWNGRYYSFDEDPNNAKTVMADQLSGFWALKICGEDVKIEEKRMLSALKTVFDLNVKSYDNGHLGAVNGFLTSNTVDTSCIQSEEVWTGITYSLSSMMIEMGMIEEAFETSKGLFESVWYKFPLQFQTPEAIGKSGMYRAIGYMRPMAIWAIQHSIERVLK